MPDDRIFVRYKYNFHKKYTVELRGAIKYPGFYAINEGRTKLTEIISEAGGFSQKANLKIAKVLRVKDVIEDKELKRLEMMTTDEMSEIELSYFRLRSREDTRLVSCDFEKLFLEEKADENILLKDRDVIIIPEERKIVYVSGGVISPGNVLFVPKNNYKDYWYK